MKLPAPPVTSRSFRSPIRGPWLTSVLGSVLLVGIPLEFVTGLVSYAAYNPRLPHNDPTPAHGALNFYLFDWTSAPSWLFQLNEGVHVIGGLALTPVVLAKLWSVMPKFFEWPPLPSPAKALERASLALLVGGILLQLGTGILNIDYFYDWSFSFYDAHFFGAWLFMAGFVAHVVLKLPVMVRSLRSRRLRDELATPLAETRPEPPDEHGLVPVDPAEPTVSRRGALALVAASSAAVVVLTAGESIGGPARTVALLAPRGRSYGGGPTDFQINKPAASAGIDRSKTGAGYRLVVRAADRTRSLTRSDLLALPQSTQRLPIACVEGWATTQTWTGVRLVDLAALVGGEGHHTLEVDSLEVHGAYGHTTIDRAEATDPRSLLALRVNGADLSLDHGYPARLIVPALPGVHNTKWVSGLTFQVA
ncbi:MAG TPA: molybdopterin-dependent oxidoreductase [Acidimicrobiales bacterium]|nr:molybdopterin-dependent oxidoreductase [Acidimicrobiales bacterium]